MRRSVRKVRGQRCLRRSGHKVSHAPPSAIDCVRYWHGATGRTPVSRSTSHAADPTRALQQNIESGAHRRAARKDPSKSCGAESISIHKSANRGSELSNSGGPQDATRPTPAIDVEQPPFKDASSILIIGCDTFGSQMDFCRGSRANT